MKYAPLLQLDDEYNDPSQRLIRWAWLLVVVVMPILALLPVPERDAAQTAKPFAERHELKAIEAPRLPTPNEQERSNANKGTQPDAPLRTTEDAAQSNADFV